MFLSHLRAKKDTRAAKTAEAAIPDLLRPAGRMIRHLWAASTWSSRASLLLRLQQFTERHRLQHLPLGVRAAAFVSNMSNIANSTRISYCSALSTTARRLGHTVPMLDLLGTALRAAGAGADSSPIRQARPCRRVDVFRLVNVALHKDNKRLAVAIYLAWKCAARWDDIVHLKKESCLNTATAAADGFWVLEWAQTKTNRKREFRPDNWTVVVEERAELDWMVQLVHEVLHTLPRGTALTTTTTAELRRLMRSNSSTAHLTAHSIKRGAVGELVDAAVEGKLDPRLIPLLAKHKDELHSWPTATLRYVEDKRKLALMLGTQHATRLL